MKPGHRIEKAIRFVLFFGILATTGYLGILIAGFCSFGGKSEGNRNDSKTTSISDSIGDWKVGSWRLAEVAVELTSLGETTERPYDVIQFKETKLDSSAYVRLKQQQARTIAMLEGYFGSTEIGSDDKSFLIRIQAADFRAGVFCQRDSGSSPGSMKLNGILISTLIENGKWNNYAILPILGVDDEQKLDSMYPESLPVVPLATRYDSSGHPVFTIGVSSTKEIRQCFLALEESGAIEKRTNNGVAGARTIEMDGRRIRLEVIPQSQKVVFVFASSLGNLPGTSRPPRVD